MRISKGSWDRQAFGGFQFDDDDDDDFEPANKPALTILGLIFALATHVFAIYGVVRVLHEQEAISWSLEWYQGIGFAAVYFILRGMNRVMYPKQVEE